MMVMVIMLMIDVENANEDDAGDYDDDDYAGDYDDDDADDDDIPAATLVVRRRKATFTFSFI